MVDKVGGVEYDVNIDASGAVSGGQKIIKNNERIEDSFQDVDLAAEKASSAMTKGAKKASKATSNLSRNVGMAGVQIGQFAGQIQGGQNALLAFSQQGADIGMLFGPAGMIAGGFVAVASAAVGVLAPSLISTKDSMDLLEDSSSKIAMTLSEASDGALKFSNSIAKLAARSESLAKAQIAQTMAEISKQVVISQNGISEALDEVSNMRLDVGFTDTLMEFGISSESAAKGLGEIAKSANGLDRMKFGGIVEQITMLSQKFGITRDQAVDLQMAFDRFKSEGGAVGISALRSALEDLIEETENANPKITDLTNKLIPFFNETASGVDMVNLLTKALSNFSDAMSGAKDDDFISKLDELSLGISNNLAIANAELAGNSQLAAELAAAFSIGLDSAERLPQTTKDLLAELIAVNEQQKINDADKLQGIRDAKAESAEAERQKGERASVIESIKKEMATEAELRDQKFASDIEALQIALQNEEITKAEYDALELARAQAHADQLIDIEKNRASKEIALERSVQNTINSMKKSALNSAVSFLDQFAGESKAAAVAAVALSKGIAIAQTMQNTATAVMKAQSVDPTGALAARTALMGKVQLGLIAATGLAQISGSGGGASSFSGGVPATTTQQSFQQQQQQQQQQNISVSGISPDEFVRAGTIVDTINGAIADGYTINFAGG